MSRPKIVLLTGYGINCEDETRYAFEKAGGDAEIVHINDLIENKIYLNKFQILVFPGGFSYGDDTGSGKALANRIKNNLIDELFTFIERDTLVLGICNGFQVMANLGIVPGFDKNLGSAQIALEHNKSSRYQCRWVDLIVEDSPSVFTKGIKTLHIPVAHGEGNFFAEKSVLDKIEDNNLVTMRYATSDNKPANGEFPFNPNGAVNDIASVCSANGRLMGMMPHPERGMFFTQRDDWTLLREIKKRSGDEIPVLSDGFKIFSNAIDYFQ